MSNLSRRIEQIQICASDVSMMANHGQIACRFCSPSHTDCDKTEKAVSVCSILAALTFLVCTQWFVLADLHVFVRFWDLNFQDLFFPVFMHLYICRDFQPITHAVEQLSDCLDCSDREGVPRFWATDRLRIKRCTTHHWLRSNTRWLLNFLPHLYHQDTVFDYTQCLLKFWQRCGSVQTSFLSRDINAGDCILNNIQITLLSQACVWKQTWQILRPGIPSFVPFLKNPDVGGGFGWKSNQLDLKCDK